VSGEGEDYFRPLLDYIRSQRGVDFTAYKTSTLRRRIAKRMQELGLDDYGDYLDRLQASPDEFEPLLDVLFINVTGFFRDAEAWDVVASAVLPDLLKTNDGDDIRIWCAGVASGQEVYTCAMLVAEATGEQDLLTRVKIFATDVDDGALAAARSALYRPEEVQDVPEEMRNKYFATLGSKLQFRQDLRRAVIFGRHNLLEDAPISRVSLLVCRNTLMYFNQEAQGRILSRFHFAMRPEGYLFLGRAEMLLTKRNLFTPAAAKARLFRKVLDLTLHDRSNVMQDLGEEEPENRVVGDLQLRDLAFDTSPVPEIVVGASGELAMANRAARVLFGLGRGNLGRPFQDVDLSFKPVELRGPVETALQEQEASEILGVEMRTPDGTLRCLDVRVIPLLVDSAALAVKVSFVDVTRHRQLTEELTSSRRDLQVAYEELQSANEELETTNEELQSTVEELETTNEELQATNEELETMNEELQSTNVEIETVNEELRSRTEDLDRLNRYVSSIVNSLSSAVIVMDPSLNVRTWNSQSEELWGLRAQDVAGKPLLGLDFGLPVHEMRDALKASISGHGGDGEAVIRGHDRRGKTLEYHTRVLPLRDLKGGVTGVIVMVDGKDGTDGAGA
jgi:two-component system CheB/CheR fusion protein